MYDVKKRLQIEVNDVSSNPELEDVIAEAMATMDEDLRGFMTVPLSTVPDLLRFACADLAASLFKGRRAKPEAHQEDLSAYFKRLYDDKIGKYLGHVANSDVLGSTSTSPLYIGNDEIE